MESRLRVLGTLMMATWLPPEHCQGGTTKHGSGHLPPETRMEKPLTHFTDGEGAGVAGVDLGRPAPGKVKQLHQAGDHLVLLLSVAQPAVAAEAPGEDALLGVQDQLPERKHTVGTGLPTGGDLVQQLTAKGLKRCGDLSCLLRGEVTAADAATRRHVFSLPRTLFSVLNYYSHKYIPHRKHESCLQSKPMLPLPVITLSELQSRDKAGLPRLTLDAPTSMQVVATWSLTHGALTFQQRKIHLLFFSASLMLTVWIT